jgi:dethiobiotin synthetase
VRCAAYKPICCGDRDDAVQFHAASNSGLTIEEVDPVWFRRPAAPLTAALADEREIDWPSLREGFVRLGGRFDFVAVEGGGGWMVPITPVISATISRPIYACRSSLSRKTASGV